MNSALAYRLGVVELVAATGSGVARVAGANDAWRATTTPLAGAQCVAVDPKSGATMYVGCRGSGVWKSEDGGASFEETGLRDVDVFAVAVSAADGALYAGCEPSALFTSADGGETWRELEALRRIPSAPTWSFPPRPWTSHVRWIAPSPHDASRLLVGIELGGVMVSEDGGTSWHDHPSGAQRDVHALAWHPTIPGRAYEAGGGGAAWSFDGGLTWKPADAGRDRHYTWGLAVDPDDPDCWYVSASPGPGQAHTSGRADAFVYRWRGNGPWQALAGGLPQPLDSMPYALLALRGLLLAGLADGRLYASGDSGDAWRELRLAGDAPARILALATVG